jgi:hypothetical protein
MGHTAHTTGTTSTQALRRQLTDPCAGAYESLTCVTQHDLVMQFNLDIDLLVNISFNYLRSLDGHCERTCLKVERL